MASSRLSLFLFVLVHALLFVSTPVSCNGGIALFLSYILIYNLFNYLLQINDQTRAASIVGTLRISCLLHLTQSRSAGDEWRHECFNYYTYYANNKY